MKPLLLYATPRSGSTPVYKLLFTYLKQTGGAVGLGEFYSHDVTAYRDTGSGIASVLVDNLTDNVKGLLRSLGQEQLLRLDDARTSLLEKYSAKQVFFLKVLSSRFADNYTYRFLMSEFQWIFLERKNLFDQMLSYLISIETNFWYTEGGIQIPPKSLRPSVNHMKFFEKMINDYHRAKKLNGEPESLYYEDFVSRSPEEFLRLGGFNKPVDLSGMRIQEKQNKGDKEDIIVNMDEVIEFYRRSSLNDLSPYR